MAYKNDKIRDLTPLTTTFVPGESPTAQKLQGMIQQADAAVARVENLLGDLTGEEGAFSTWVSTLARDIGDFSKLNPLILPDFQITNYQQELIAGETEHELDLIPIGDLNDLIQSTADSCVVISQFKTDVSELEEPGDWTISYSYTEDSQLKRGRKLVTHSPSEGGSVIFKTVTSGRGSSLESSSENTIPNLAQAQDDGPFAEIELVDNLNKIYQVTLPVRAKMYDKVGSIVDFTASNSKAGVGLGSQYELPHFFFGVDGLDLDSNDELGNPKSIPLNLIKLYDWDTKKEVEGIIALKASTSTVSRKFQFTVQTRADVLLNTSTGRYIIVVPGNSIINQLKGLIDTVYNNDGVGNDMARLISHKNLLGLRTGSVDIADRSKYYGPSNIDNNDHSMYFHRNGYTALDKGAGGNVIRGDVVVGSTETGASDTVHENFNVDDDSHSLHFGNIANGPKLKYVKENLHTIDHSYGGLPTSLTDSGLWIEGAISDVDGTRKNIFLEGDIRTSGNTILGKLNTDIVFIQGKLYINDELTLIPRTTSGITGEEGKIIYSSVEKAPLFYNGSSWVSPWNTAGYATTVGDGINSFGKYNGTNHTPFANAITEVTSTGGVIKVLPGNYNFLINKISIPANVIVEGSGVKTVISGTGIIAETTGANAGIKNLIIQNGLKGLYVNSSGVTVQAVHFVNCSKAIEVSGLASDLNILQDVTYSGCTANVDYVGSALIQANELVTKSAINYSFGSNVNDWNAKASTLTDYTVTSGSLAITFDAALESAIGVGAFRLTGTGTLVSRKKLPVNPNVGIGGFINMKRQGALGVVSIGVVCYDSSYNILGTRNFLYNTYGLGNGAMESSFQKRTMSGIGATDITFPTGTRFVQPTISVTSNDSGIIFDSFEVMNLSYAKDTSYFMNSVLSGVDIDWEQGSLFYKNISGATTFTFSNVVEGKVISLAVENTTGGSLTIAFPAGIYKDPTIALSVLAGKTNVYTFVRVNNKTYVSYITSLSNV